FELAGVDREIVKEDGGDDDPDDFQESEAGAIEKAAGCQLIWHAKNENGDKDRRQGSCNRAKMRTDLQPREQSEQNNQRQGGDQRGKPPMAQRVIYLRPSHEGSSRPRRRAAGGSDSLRRSRRKAAPVPWQNKMWVLNYFVGEAKSRHKCRKQPLRDH